MIDGKAGFRSKMREIAETRRDAIALSRQLSAQLRDWPLWKLSGKIAAFSALAGEPDALDPWPLDKEISLPRVLGDKLIFHQVRSRSELSPASYGIREPATHLPSAGSEFDLILVPGLAFDPGGGRLGRGKGFYDRFLAGARGPRAGVCFDDQIVDQVPVEPHDLRMDFVVTPSAIYRCGS